MLSFRSAFFAGWMLEDGSAGYKSRDEVVQPKGWAWAGEWHARTKMAHA